MATISSPSQYRNSAKQQKNHSPSGSWSNWSIEDLPRILSIVPLVLLPWLFGASDPSIEGLGMFWTAGCFVIWVVTVILGGRQAPVVFPVVGLLVAAGIGLGLFQFTSISSKTLQQIAPGLMSLRQEFVSLDEPSEFPLLKRGTQKNSTDFVPLSVNPAASRHAVAVMVWSLACFILGANLFSDPVWSRRLLVVLAANGSLLAFFGIVQAISWNGALFWSIELTQGGSPFGPFVNRNNAGCFLNQTFGCVIAALYIAYSARLKSLPDIPTGRSRSLRRSAIFYQLQTFFADLNAWQLSAISMVFVTMTAILFTLSRGTIVAFLFTSGFFLWTIWKLPINRSILILIVVAGLGGLWLADSFGILEGWESRFREAADYAENPDDRLQLWSELLTASRVSPWLGSGAGTLRYVLPLFHTRIMEKTYQHAENQYLETLLEFGYIGVTLLAGILLVMMLTLVRLRREYQNDLEGNAFPVFLAGFIALVSQMIGSCFDFGLTIPANMILMASIAGMTSGAWIYQRRGFSEKTKRYRQNTLRPALILILLVVAGLGWSVLEERDAVAASIATQQAMYEQYSADGDDNPYPNVTTAAIDQSRALLEKALARRPDDVDAHYQLGQLWLLRYQIVAFADLLKDRKQLDLGDLPLWNLTDISIAQMSACGFAESQDAAGLETLRNEPIVQENLIPALESFIASRRASGLHAGVQSHLGWLSWLGADPLSADKYAADSVRLAPQNPETLVDAGTICFNSGHLEQATTYWQKALLHRPEAYQTISNLADSRWTNRDVIERVLPRDPTTIFKVARLLELGGNLEESRNDLANCLEQSLAAANQTSGLHEEKAMLARMRGDLKLADQELQNAIQMNRSSVQAHFDRSRVLYELEEYNQALSEIAVCIQFQPNNLRWKSEERRIRQAILKKKNAFSSEIPKPASR